MIVRLLRSILRIGNTAQITVLDAKKEDLKSFLSSHGVELLTPSQLKQISHDFSSHLKAGFAGKSLSLATIPSLLHAAPLREEHLGKKTLVIEMGGTNCYAALVEIQNQGDEFAPVITKSEAQPYLTTDKQFANPHAFFAEVAEVVQSVADGSSVHAIGVIWSFAGKAEATMRGVDEKALYLDKGFFIPGIESILVGEQLLPALEEVGVPVPPSVPIAVLNDTVAVLLAGGGKLGGVIGTGVNFAVEHNGQIYNLEAGAFSEVPKTPLASAVDEMDRPGTMSLEKQVSGKYIGMQLDTVVSWLLEKGLLPGVVQKEGEHLEAEHLSALLSGDREKVGEVLSPVADPLYAMLSEVAEILRNRSAQIAGTILGTLINEVGEELPNEVVIPIEGSFFAKTPGYKEAVVKWTKEIILEKFAHKHIVFKSVEQSGIKGAAVAALTVKE